MSEEKEAHQTFLFNTIIIVPLIKIMSSEEKCGVFYVVLFLLGIILGLNFDSRLLVTVLVCSNFSCGSYNFRQLRGKCDDIKIVSRNTSDNCCLHNFSWLKWGNSWNKTKQDIGLKYTVLFYCVLCSCWIHCTILLCIMFMLNTPKLLFWFILYLVCMRVFI